MISLVKKDYDSTKIYRKTHKKGASQTYDTPSFYLGVVSFSIPRPPFLPTYRLRLCRHARVAWRGRDVCPC